MTNHNVLAPTKKNSNEKKHANPKSAYTAYMVIFAELVSSKSSAKNNPSTPRHKNFNINKEIVININMFDIPLKYKSPKDRALIFLFKHLF